MKMEKESESIREHVSSHDGEWHTANRKLWVFFLKKMKVQLEGSLGIIGNNHNFNFFRQDDV